MKHTIKEIAENRELWNEYVDPQGNDNGEFDKPLEEKMQMIADLFSEYLEWNDEKDGE